MKVRKETAKRVLKMLETMTPAQAAHECFISLRSIKPYTDRSTSSARELLLWLERRSDHHEVNVARLKEIAGNE
jgi:hypothetical protein